MFNLTDEQVKILQDIYNRSEGGKHILKIGEGHLGVFQAKDQQSREYIENLKILQDNRYISGITTGVDFLNHDTTTYTLPKITITKMGIDYIESLSSK
ncbi:hypothetical protein LS68_008975 [Helicobacter sp. MIT 05-5293]|uniref:hypothetical protein n=1 Tax=Helicobacter sp. MIT 05-5293 TaxID=1548149 RepID=UPI00051DA99F|nr:hypothetical protein [Helicobacter sp. MIT 05-5293]TLD79961.1 hypothetical protein LS68_008975 [Helicobacter sp. MIT 05-5293]